MPDRRCEGGDRVEGVLDHVPPVYVEAYERRPELVDAVRLALGNVLDGPDADAMWDAMQEVIW